ncbi:MAG: right-handed parallel beta-helix repeat-containing protein [candidate division Zixibacteria bacterium]|nr:right-handed parallel beta-helix repeat-containing protein [candidate division Zixibacteria bacterium]
MAVGFCQSSDGGASFSAATRIQGLNVQGIRGTIKSSPHSVLVNSYPAMAVDTSRGPYRGTIYIVWADGRNGKPDVYLTKRRAGDTVWQSPVRVNDDSTTTDQWSPWISVDPDGLVHVVFYDSRVDPVNDLLTAVYMATSCDGGNSFENFLVSDVAFTPSEIRGARPGFVGDYIGITSDRGMAYPCWNDNRTGIHQAYMARVPTQHIYTNTHWQGAITVSHDIIVESGATLYVDPGVTVSCLANRDGCPSPEGIHADKISIIVKGSLNAQGCTFTSTAQTPATGDWEGIRVKPGGSAYLKNCAVNYADTGVYLENPSSATADSNLFYRNGTAIYLDHGTDDGASIRYNTFDHDAIGIKLVSAMSSWIEWNTFRGAAASENGIVCTGSPATIKRNVFDSLGGSAILSQNNSSPPVLVIENNDILRCGVGLNEASEATLYLRNNVIDSNGTGVLGVEQAELSYDDVWGNQVNYSGSAPGTGDISANPKFVDTGHRDLHLDSTSPCIDTGHPNSQSDPDGTRADMGVYYYSQGTPGGGGGCPYVYVWNGTEYRKDNTILTESERTPQGATVTDFYKLRQPLAETGGEYRLQVREFEREVSHLDAFEVLSVDHPPSSDVGVTPDGRVFAYSEEDVPYAAFDNTGRDVLSQIIDQDGVLYSSDEAGALDIYFRVRPHSPAGYVL